MATSVMDDPIEPDSDTYFDSDVTWEFAGGYDGFDFPSADRGVTFHLLQVVQLGELQTYVTRTVPLQILTAPVPVDLDSAMLIPTLELRFTERGSGTFTPPDSAEVYDNWAHAGQMGTAPAALEADAGLRLSGSGSGRVRNRTRTGGFVGPAEAAAELARLRASGANEERVGTQQLRFRLNQQLTAYEFDFDETVGAIVATRVSEGGRDVVRTTREYRPVRGGHRLFAETTQLYRPDGTAGERYRATYESR